ncbi:MAG: porin, partial [Pseudomonadota bacterium]
KILTATTALVAVGFAGSANAAEPITASVGGYFFTGVGYADAETWNATTGTLNDRDGFGVIRDGEIYFTATGSSDNGLTFTGHVQLEAFTSGDQIDENWVEVEGSFGQVRIGGDDHASYNMAVGNQAFRGAHIAVLDGFGKSGGPAAFESHNRFGDQIALHYYTPRISGFQLGASWMPDGTTDGAFDSNNLVTGMDGDVEDVLSIGANYIGDFSGVSLGLSAGYDYVSEEGYAVAGDPTTDIGDTDGFTLGATLGYAGFKLGGIWQEALDDQSMLDNVDKYIGTLSYGTGPWTFGVAYGRFEEDRTDGFEQDKIAGWVDYALAPGVQLGAGVEWSDADAYTDAFGEAAPDQEGVAGVVMLGLSF